MPPSTTDVDTTLHPSPTGRAGQLALLHTSPDTSLVLYGGWFCPFVQRVWIVLEELAIPYQYVEINPYKKEKAFLDINPRGLVPALGVRGQSKEAAEGNGKDGGEKALYESLVICEYLEEVYGTDGSKPSLFPLDPFEKAHCRIWIDFISTRIIPAFYRFCQHQPQSTYTLAEARETFLNHLKTFITAADSQGPYFLGETVSMVDVALAPWLARLWVLDHFKDGGVGIPESGGAKGAEEERVWERWRLWAEVMGQRESLLGTTSDREMYVPAYRRYAEDTTQSQVGRATREGRSLP